MELERAEEIREWLEKMMRPGIFCIANFAQLENGLIDT